MKKLFSLLFVVVLLVAGCGTTTPEPTRPIEVPTEIPTEVPTEIPTEVSTEAPTEEPTPTEEVVCPSEIVEATSPEDLFIILDGDGTRIQATEANDGQRSFYLLAMHEPATLYQEGGEFSFTMPSAGFVFLGKNTTYDGEGSIARTPEGDLLIPKGMTLSIKTQGGFAFPESIVQIIFIGGETISIPTPPDLEGANISIRCNNLWEISVENTSKEDIEIPILGKLQYILNNPDGVANVETSWGKIPGAEIQTGAILSEGDKITLLPNGSVTFILWDFYPVK